MKQVLTKQDVVKALAELSAKGKKVTLAMLHAAVGNRGSMSTLVRIKGEIEAEAQPVEDSAEALHAFREIWALAVEQGRKQQESVLFECRESLKVLCAENERFDALVAASEARLAELRDEKSRTESDLHRIRSEADAEINRTKSALAETLQQLATAQAAHGAQVSRLQGDLDEATHKAHEVELKLARAQALLEVRSTPGGPA